MDICGYGVANSCCDYSALANKEKAFPVFTLPPEEKPKPEVKNKNTTSYDQLIIRGYDPFKEMDRTGSVSLPSWIYTKTEPSMSDEEILKDMEELAKRHAKQGIFHNQDDEYLSLIKEYVTSVSPDRESILRDTVREIKEDIKASIPKGSIEKAESYDLIDTLMKELANDDAVSDIKDSIVYINGGINYNMSGSNYDAGVEKDGSVTAAEFYDDKGDVVMYFSNRNNSGKLSVEQCFTKEECTRRTELLEVYNKTYREAIRSISAVSGNAVNAMV